MQVVAREGPAHGQRERAVVAVALLVDVGQADVVRLLALALDPGVLEPGAAAHRDLGDRIGPVGSPGRERDVALDDGCPRAALDHDQVARMRHGARRVRGRDEEQVHRRVEIDAGADMDDAALTQERRVERGERRAVDRAHAA